MLAAAETLQETATGRLMLSPPDSVDSTSPFSTPSCTLNLLRS
jgi:hypothetical protein